MIACRILKERPTAGGEKFSARIGPAPFLRRGTPALLAGALLAAAGGVLRVQTGTGGGVLLLCALGLGGLSVLAGWLSGGPESLVCQGGVLRHRRHGGFGEERHERPTRDLRRVHPPRPGHAAATRGIRLEFSHESWSVGRGLSRKDAEDLVWLLNRHLSLSPEEAIDSVPVERVSFARSRPVDSPARTSPGDVARTRTR